MNHYYSYSTWVIDTNCKNVSMQSEVFNIEENAVLRIQTTNNGQWYYYRRDSIITLNELFVGGYDEYIANHLFFLEFEFKSTTFDAQMNAFQIKWKCENYMGRLPINMYSDAYPGLFYVLIVLISMLVIVVVALMAVIIWCKLRSTRSITPDASESDIYEVVGESGVYETEIGS